MCHRGLGSRKVGGGVSVIYHMVPVRLLGSRHNRFVGGGGRGQFRRGQLGRGLEGEGGGVSRGGCWLAYQRQRCMVAVLPDKGAVGGSSHPPRGACQALGKQTQHVKSRRGGVGLGAPLMPCWFWIHVAYTARNLTPDTRDTRSDSS